MTEINFFLSDADTERLFAIKDLQGLDDLTGSDFARQLLTDTLRGLFPAVPKYDDNGTLTNADRYKGAKQCATKRSCCG